MAESGPHVLVVEDEPQMRRFLRTALTAREFAVSEAENLWEAQLAATVHPPELILLDLGLPDGDGIDFTREIRSWSRVSIIVLSARGREEDKVMALDAGADDYLTKPFGVAGPHCGTRLRLLQHPAPPGGGDRGTHPALR